MRLTERERESIEKVSAISGKDVNTVKDVLRSLVIMITLELLDYNDEVSIPYLCDLNILYSMVRDSTGELNLSVDLGAKVSEALYEEVKNIVNNDLTPSMEFIRKSIFKNIQDKLELDENFLDGI